MRRRRARERPRIQTVPGSAAWYWVAVWKLLRRDAFLWLRVAHGFSNTGELPPPTHVCVVLPEALVGERPAAPLPWQPPRGELPAWARP